MHRKEDSRSCQLLPLGLLLLAPLVGHEPSESFDFRYDVLPVLERSGCASAYCHGSATGRGGFKLSLFGSDPLADYGAITQEFGGRRLDFLNVEKSLLLQKPALRIKHGGGAWRAHGPGAGPGLGPPPEHQAGPDLRLSAQAPGPGSGPRDPDP
ncbi:MAG: hypothetical protein ACE5F1_21915 [Planctomycetota bacterium]